MIIAPDELFALKEALWSGERFADYQYDIVESVCSTPITVVPAGNKMGKGYITGFICIGCFIICQVRDIGCRIVTTSVEGDHLKVLWGEIGRFATSASVPLLKTPKNPDGLLVMNHQEIKRSSEEEVEEKNVLHYLRGLVYDKPEKLQGHHAEFTLFVGDEASGLEDAAYSAAQGWAKRVLFIGNTLPCSNFFYRAVEGDPATGDPGGDLVAA